MESSSFLSCCTIYVRGISKKATRESILAHFSQISTTTTSSSSSIIPNSSSLIDPSSAMSTNTIADIMDINSDTKAGVDVSHPNGILSLDWPGDTIANNSNNSNSNIRRVNSNKATCHIHYLLPKHAQQAIQQFNRSYLHGIALSVRFDQHTRDASNANGIINSNSSVDGSTGVADDKDTQSCQGMTSSIASTGISTSWKSCQRMFIYLPRKIQCIGDDGTILDDSAIARDSKDNAGNIQHTTRDNSSDISAISGISGIGKVIKRQRRGSQLPIVRYTNDGLLCDNISYPTPRGLYLMQLLQLSGSLLSSTSLSGVSSDELESTRAILQLILGRQHGNQQAKELSESMAMVTGTWRLFELLGMDVMSPCNDVTVYVLGDGKMPFTALLMALYMPSHWRFVSIDPLMQFDVSSLPIALAQRMKAVQCLSEEYEISSCIDVIPDSVHGPDQQVVRRSISLVIACHSHAPLEEFWDRLVKPICQLSDQLNPAKRLRRDESVHPDKETHFAFPNTSDGEIIDKPPADCGSIPLVVHHRLSVSMPCCGKTWSILPNVSPIHEYEDYEVYSARRRVLLYADVGTR